MCSVMIAAMGAGHPCSPVPVLVRHASATFDTSLARGKYESTIGGSTYLVIALVAHVGIFH